MGLFCADHQPPAKEFKPRLVRDGFLDTQAWRKLSRWKLAASPNCEKCLIAGRYSPAQDVDHVLPRATHPELALDPSNLQSLCKVCHLRKTKSEISNREEF
jgi:5-methylcytosine-specific restriction protein A